MVIKHSKMLPWGWFLVQNDPLIKADPLDASDRSFGVIWGPRLAVFCVFLWHVAASMPSSDLWVLRIARERERERERVNPSTSNPNPRCVNPNSHPNCALSLSLASFLSYDEKCTLTLHHTYRTHIGHIHRTHT